jgi:hypothetical protein
MRIAVQITAAAAIAALVGAPLPASSQAARLLGETDGASRDTVAAASSAGPIVSPIHKKTGDLARFAREAAQAAVSAPAFAKPAATPLPAADVAEPAAGAGGTTAPLGNQPADNVTDTPVSAPAASAAPNHGSVFRTHTRVRTLRA